MKAYEDVSDLKDEIIDEVLKTLREQRDLKQIQELYDLYTVNPQIFQTGKHFVTERIPFNSPFRTRPMVTFGFYVDRNTTGVATDDPIATGYTPPIIVPYIYSFTYETGSVDGFLMGLYSLTDIPTTTQRFTVSWRAIGKGSVYPAQRVGEAWGSSYNHNEPDYLVNNQTGLTR